MEASSTTGSNSGDVFVSSPFGCQLFFKQIRSERLCLFLCSAPGLKHVWWTESSYVLMSWCCNSQGLLCWSHAQDINKLRIKVKEKLTKFSLVWIHEEAWKITSHPNFTSIVSSNKLLTMIQCFTCILRLPKFFIGSKTICLKYLGTLFWLLWIWFIFLEYAYLYVHHAIWFNMKFNATEPIA